MSLYIPKMSDTPGVTIPGLASNFNALADSRIVEYGENENGTYWRWENGLQVCVINLPTLDEFTDMGSRGSFTHFRKYNIYYPASFLSAPKTLAGVAGSVDGSIRAVIATVRSSTTSDFRLDLFIDDEVIKITVTNCLAVGRWK